MEKHRHTILNCAQCGMTTYIENTIAMIYRIQYFTMLTRIQKYQNRAKIHNTEYYIMWINQKYRITYWKYYNNDVQNTVYNYVNKNTEIEIEWNP
jgi:hypothetical protein